VHDPMTDVETRYSWVRLGIAIVLSTIGGVGLWSGVVALPAVQAEFAVARAEASLPYTLSMLGFGVGGMIIGRLVDRFGVVRPLAGSAILLGLGYVAAASAASLWQFTLVYGFLIGVGAAATFAPLIADISHWFLRRRGIAVALCATGNYIAGTFWPPILEHFIRVDGWRMTHLGVGLFCIATMAPLTLALRRAAPHHLFAASEAVRRGQGASLRLSPRALQTALMIAGLACCMAMAMPQVHLVAYCGDLGYGVTRGAQMLSLMLGFGIVSRIASGFVADSIGGLRTLLLGSALQGTALLLYLLFNGLTSLYVISVLFGLFQGGIVPSYAVIVREYFPPREAGTRVGSIIMATVVGMALGGWMSGAIFDLTGSYRAAFANGLAWNVLNAAITIWLLMRQRSGGQLALA
jgi:MFS family permease